MERKNLTPYVYDKNLNKMLEENRVYHNGLNIEVDRNKLKNRSPSRCAWSLPL